MSLTRGQRWSFFFVLRVITQLWLLGCSRWQRRFFGFSSFSGLSFNGNHLAFLSLFFCPTPLFFFLLLLLSRAKQPFFFFFLYTRLVVLFRRELECTCLLVLQVTSKQFFFPSMEGDSVHLTHHNHNYHFETATTTTKKNQQQQKRERGETE